MFLVCLSLFVEEPDGSVKTSRKQTEALLLCLSKLPIKLSNSQQQAGNKQSRLSALGF